MTVEVEFLELSASRLLESMSRIESCVAQLTPEQVWQRGSKNENAVGNLLLHLRGNVGQWILSGVGGSNYHRDRDSEFDAREGAGAPHLLAGLRAVVEEAAAIIRQVPAERLLRRIHVQVYEVTVLGAIYHVVEHFSGHLFQIILLTKVFTHQDLGFYAHLRSGKSSSALP
jgi:hypothetical protein